MIVVPAFALYNDLVAVRGDVSKESVMADKPSVAVSVDALSKDERRLVVFGLNAYSAVLKRQAAKETDDDIRSIRERSIREIDSLINKFL